jgi:hypothetical protein
LRTSLENYLKTTLQYQAARLAGSSPGISRSVLSLFSTTRVRCRAAAASRNRFGNDCNFSNLMFLRDGQDELSRDTQQLTRRFFNLRKIFKRKPPTANILEQSEKKNVKQTRGVERATRAARVATKWQGLENQVS